MDRDIEFMREALELARLAADMGEIPVGALVVDSNSGEVIARAHNLRENNKLATAHAEILAIEAACRKRGGWRLNGCTLYVTLEPCPMCAGAIINARVPMLVYGAADAVSGSCGSVIDLFFERYGHRPKVLGGVLGEEAAALLRAFFTSLR